MDRLFDPADFKFTLSRVRLDRGGYDSAGRYWGIAFTRAQILWTYDSPMIGSPGYCRALDRETAKSIVLARNPNARFYR